MERESSFLETELESNVERSIGCPLTAGSVDSTQLLPGNQSFGALLWPFLAPYFVYVFISSIPEGVLAAQWGQAIKLVLTGGVLFLFRRQYRLGGFKPGYVPVALVAFPLALLCWIGPLYVMNVSGIAAVADAGSDSVFSQSYYYLRLFNSVFLVAIFEELFVRVYVMGWLYQAGVQRNGKPVFSTILDTLDQFPLSLSSLPLSAFSMVGATIVFAAGHQPHEYLSAVLYFLFTTWIYHNTRSLWVCILIHGFSNLAIALLVRHAGMGWLW